MTQELLCMPFRVGLDKTSSTSKWKFTIGHLTLSISIIKFDADMAAEKFDVIRFF